MKFNIESDEGHAIGLWMTLDHPSDVPSLDIHSGDKMFITLAANVNRPDLCDHDLHTTGQAGFAIDDSIVPELARKSDLQLSDHASGIPIYARFISDRHHRKKVLIWAAASEILRRDVGSMLKSFSLIYRDLIEYNAETVGSIIGNSSVESILAIGRINLLRFRELLERQQFEVVFVISDPYIDLAERLIALRSDAMKGDHNVSLLKLSHWIQQIDISDNRALARFFRTLQGNERLVFRSPVVRALTRSPEEDVRRQDVSTALKVLSKYNYVCTDQTLNVISSQLAHLSAIGANPVRSAEVVSLADVLRDIGAASDIINEDAALYHYVGRAVAAAQSRMHGDAGTQ